MNNIVCLSTVRSGQGDSREEKDTNLSECLNVQRYIGERSFFNHAWQQGFCHAIIINNNLLMSELFTH